MGGITEGAIIAIASAASAGAAIYSATNKPKLPSAPKIPVAPEVKVADVTPLSGQRQRRAAAAGKAGTLLTGPGGLGSTSGAGAGRSTLLGG